MKAKVNGIEVNYEIHGKEGAPWLTFSHSLACSLRMWEPQVAAFQDRFRILLYDTRGHGATEAPKGASFGLPFCTASAPAPNISPTTTTSSGASSGGASRQGASRPGGKRGWKSSMGGLVRTNQNWAS